MKRNLSFILAVAMLLAIFLPSIKAEAKTKFDYEKRKAELKAEREELYSWYEEILSQKIEELYNNHKDDSIVFGSTPGLLEKYVEVYKPYLNGYNMKNPAPETIQYNDEFYTGTLSIVDVKMHHIIPIRTEFFVTYAGYVHLKDCYRNMPEEELAEKMEAYYKEKASEPIFESEAR